MKALILAAGIGSRLSPLTDDCPKSMIAVNGMPILMKQVENLYQNGIEYIIIVGGYHVEKLAPVQKRYPFVQLITNEDYLTTNNMYSAYLAESMIHESCLMMNADVFFDASVVHALLACEAPDAIVTDVGTYMEESMKVTVVNGRITEIAKTIPSSAAFGTSIDVYKFSAEGIRAFFKKCAEYIVDKKELRKWSEVALNDILSEIAFSVCPLEGRWFEIDTLEDLHTAEAIFAD